MPVRQLDILLNEQRALVTESISTLSGIRLGIDATHWLRRLISLQRETGIVPLGATAPLSLRTLVEQDIKYFRNNRIQPFVVFPGLNVRKDKPFINEDSKASKRNAAWEAYARGHHNSAFAQWKSTSSPLSEMLPLVIQILTELQVEFMRAPYSSWGQLVYMYKHPQQLIHAIYAGSDALIFDIDRVIVNLETDKNVFQWVDKPTLLHSLVLTSEQFLDCCILAGFDWINTYGPLASDPVIPFNWGTLMDMIRQLRTGFNLINSIGEPNAAKSQYFESFTKTRCAIKHHLVLTTEGYVQLLNQSQAPGDLHEVFGLKFPDQIYYFLAHGLFSPLLLNCLLTGVVPEHSPMCNGDTVEYQKLLDAFMVPRSQAIGLLTSTLPPPFHARRITTSYWHQSTNEYPMSPIGNLPGNELQWCLSKTFFSSAGQNGSHASLASCAKALQEERTAGMIVNSAPSNLNGHQVVAEVCVRLLELRGFVDMQHCLTRLGRVYADTISKSKSSSHQFDEEIFLIAELLIQGVLHGSPYSKTYHSSRTTEPDSVHFALLTRIACCLEPKYKDEQWEGPFNRDILVASSMFKLTTRTLHNMCEMLLLVLLVTGRTNLSQQDMKTLAQSLPFAPTISGLGNKTAGMGLLMNEYFTQLLGDAEGDRHAAVAHLTRRLTNIQNVSFEIDRFFVFWDVVLHLVKGLQNAGIIGTDVYNQFKASDEWLRHGPGKADAPAIKESGQNPAPSRTDSVPNASAQHVPSVQGGGYGRGKSRGGRRGSKTPHGYSNQGNE